MNFVLPFIFCCLSYMGKTQAPVTIGQKAPKFIVDLFHEETPVCLDSISGNKIIVIEFWATWCVYCIKAFPHLNELQKEFDDKDVVFLSLTYESNRGKIDSCLKKYPLNTKVALDRDFRMFRAYGAWAIPQTIIINKSRDVVVSIHPDQLTAKIIKDVLEGKPLDIPNNGKQAYFDPKGAEEYFRKLEKEGKN